MPSKINTTVKQDRDLVYRAHEEFGVVDDMKMRISMIKMADKWNNFARAMIYQTYNDTQLLLLYKQARDDGTFQSGGKSKVRREVIRFPNGYVYNFCKAVLEPMYGPEWCINKQALRHEIMRPWLLIKLK